MIKSSPIKIPNTRLGREIDTQTIRKTSGTSTAEVFLESPTFRYTHISMPDVSISYVNDKFVIYHKLPGAKQTTADQLIALLKQTPGLIYDIERYQLGRSCRLNGQQLQFAGLAELYVYNKNSQMVNNQTFNVAYDINNQYRFLNNTPDRAFLKEDTLKTLQKIQVENDTTQLDRSISTPLYRSETFAQYADLDSKDRVTEGIEDELQVLPPIIDRTNMDEFIRAILGFDLYDDRETPFNRGLFLLNPDNSLEDGIFALQIQVYKMENNRSTKLVDKLIPLRSAYELSLEQSPNIIFRTRYLYRRGVVDPVQIKGLRDYYMLPIGIDISFLEVFLSPWNVDELSGLDVTTPEVLTDINIHFLSDREALICWDTSDLDIDYYVINNNRYTSRYATLLKPPESDFLECEMYAVDTSGNEGEVTSFTLDFFKKLANQQPLEISGTTDSSGKILALPRGARSINLGLGVQASGTLTTKIHDLDAGNEVTTINTNIKLRKPTT